jgi:predicted Zn-dependent protease
VCLPLLGAASFVSARAYASQSAWLASLVAGRPDDPSGYVMAAAWFLRQRDYPRAREAVRRAPRADLPPALSHDLAEQLLRVGLRGEAIELMENTLRAHPTAPLARFDGLIAHSLQGRFDQAYALARQLAPETALCPPTRAWLTGWLDRADLPAAERPKLERVLGEVRCTGAVR